MALAIEIAGRTLLIFVWVLVGFRLSGKRHLGQMNIYDLAMVMAVSNAIQNAVTKGSGELVVGLTSSTVLLTLGWAASTLTSRSERAAGLLQGKATVLVNNGHVEPGAMERENITHSDINKAMRSVGISQLSDVRMVVLEVDGTLSVVPVKGKKTADESPRPKKA